jgi:hypothetical protein
LAPNFAAKKTKKLFFLREKNVSEAKRDDLSSIFFRFCELDFVNLLIGHVFVFSK